MSRRRLSRMDKFVQKEVKDLRPVYNGKIPIQEIVKSLTKKKKREERDSKYIDLSADIYGIIQNLIKEKALITDDRDRLIDLEKNKLNVYIDQLSSKREDGMVIIRPSESKYPK
jgi:phage-related tail protein